MISETISYNEIDKRIESIRAESLDWLKNSLANEK